MIYDAAFEGRRSTDRNALALRLVCREINHECTKIAFSQITFVVREMKWKPAPIVNTLQARRSYSATPVCYGTTKDLFDRLKNLPKYHLANVRRLQIVDGAETSNANSGKAIANMLPNTKVVRFLVTHGGWIPNGFKQFMEQVSRMRGPMVVEMARHTRLKPSAEFVDQWMEMISKKYLSVDWKIEADTEGTTLTVTRKI
jgi:hypothetical protein